jgi:oligopeptide transport system ATP-binding protein
VLYRGVDILKVTAEELRAYRRKLQIVFQDPYSSLNPRITVGGMLREILQFHKIATGNKINERVDELLNTVGLAPEYANRYPHEFSGGQRQRIGIVRALAVDPEFLVLDEPVSALDVSIQAQILNLLKDLQKKLGLSYLFISHALSVVDHISDETAVMYLGRVVESGETSKIVSDPLHPYTKALIAAVPRPDPALRHTSEPLAGDVPNSIHPPTGCHFHPRCPSARPECSTWVYELKDLADNRKVACLLY